MVIEYSIPYGKQDIDEDDISSVLQVLKSDFLTQGPMVPAFESAVSSFCRSKFSIAVNSATSALHIALLALDVGPGDTVWTSPITFVASANAVLYCGANVDFVDIDPLTYNMSVNALKEKLILAKIKGQLPKVVLPVHLSGQPCDMLEIHKLSLEYGFHIVEDASHGIGGYYNKRPIGCCDYSDITVFSFHPVKIITTAEGGMAVTNNYELKIKMELARNHGITRDKSMMSNFLGEPWYYEQIGLGYNYRLTDLQAALGFSQIKKIETYIHKRHLIAERYQNELKNLPLILPYQAEFSHSSYHLFIVKLNLKDTNPLTHLEFFQALRNRGILVNLHYIPVHTQPFYRSLGFNWGDFPQAEDYYKSAVSLPIFPSMTDEQQAYVIDTIIEILKL